MGIFDSLFGGGDDKSTTTSTTQYSPFVTGAQNLLAQNAFQGMVPYLTNPTAFTAPLSGSQNRVGQAAGGLLDYAQGTQGLGQLPDYSSQFAAGQGSLNGYLGSSGAGALSPYVGSAQSGLMEQYIPGYSQQAIDASTIDNADIMAFANPLRDQMMEVDARQRGDAYGRTQRDIGSRAAAEGSFGGSGSGEYLQRAMGARDYQRDSADAATKIAYDSYGTGAQLAGNNASARTAALQNAGNDIYNRAMGSRQFDAGERDALYSRAAGAAGFDQGAIDALFGRAATAGQFDQSALGNAANYGLSRGQYGNTAANDYVSRMGAAGGLLGAYGDLERSYAQAQGDTDWTRFSRLAQFIPGISGTTTQTGPNTNPGLGQTLLGAGLMVGGMPTAGGGSLLGNWLG